MKSVLNLFSFLRVSLYLLIDLDVTHALLPAAANQSKVFQCILIADALKPIVRQGRLVDHIHRQRFNDKL